MFVLTVTQKGDVCHVKWKHRALCLCIWTENSDRFLWKCRYHLGHCSQDSPSRQFFFIPSVGLTEHLCYLDFHLPGEMLGSESMIFPCSLVLAEGLLTLPFLIVYHLGLLHRIFWGGFFLQDKQDHLPCLLLQCHLFCQSVDHYLALIRPLKSLGVLNSGGFWFASPYGQWLLWPVCQSPLLSVLRHAQTTALFDAST